MDGFTYAWQPMPPAHTDTTHAEDIKHVCCWLVFAETAMRL